MDGFEIEALEKLLVDKLVELVGFLKAVDEFAKLEDCLDERSYSGYELVASCWCFQW